MSRHDLNVVKDLIEDHNKLKREVLKALQGLADEAEGLVIEKIETELSRIKERLVGRGIIICSGILSLCLLPINPIASAAVGVTGIVIGYAVVAGSKWFEMRSTKKHAERLSSIYEELQKQLDLYTASQENIFRALNDYHVFESGKDFKKNLKIIKDLVEEAEEEANCVGIFDIIEEFLSKLRKAYNNLDEDQRSKLNSKDFLMTMGKLLAGAGVVDNLSSGSMRLADYGTAAASAIGDIASSGPWWEVFQGLNIAFNVGFMVWDIKKFLELQKMREDWYEGGKVRVELLKNDKFKKEINMRDQIREIRDSILANGY